MKIWGLLLLIFIPYYFLLGQEAHSPDYYPDDGLLLWGNNPIPSWLDTVINLDESEQQFHFIKKFSLPFDVWGWKPIEEKITYQDKLKAGNFTAPEKYIDEGWVYSNKPVSNIPLGWMYSPIYYLYFNVEGVQKIHRFFSQYLGDIPLLKADAMNIAKINQFFRLIFEPEKDIAFITLDIPENMVIAYKTILFKGTGQRVYVLYTFDNNANSTLFIKGLIHYIQGQKKPFLYKIQFINTEISKQ